MSRAIGALGRFVDRVGWVIAIAFVLIGFWVLKDQGKDIKHLIAQHHADQVAKNKETAEQSRNAAINRAVNVESWCDGLNAINTYDRLIVRKAAHGAIVYTLADLPCELIIAETLKSATTHTTITPTNHPLVFGALHP
jgi:hypothetical protein